MVTDRTRERAQMILVGGVAIAVIIVGLAVIINTVVYSEATITSESTNQLDEAREFDHESRKGMRTLVLRLNHRDRNYTASHHTNDVVRNVTNYSRLLGQSYANSQAAYVEIEYHNDSSGWGQRIVQKADSGVTSDATDDADWEPMSSGPKRKVGWFTMSVDVDDTSKHPGYVNVTNATGAWVNVSINRTGNGPGALVNVTSNVSHAGNTTTQCNPSRGRVLFDFVQGETYTGSCSFNGTDEVAPPYTSIVVTNGTNIVGKYEIVVNDSISSPGWTRCSTTGPPGTQPCSSPVIWTANVTAAFHGSDAEYANRFNVSVYPRGTP